MIKTTGTRDEVWTGTARKTGGGLVKADLLMNPRGKIVSIKQSNAAKLRYPALLKKLCNTPAAPAPIAPAPVAQRQVAPVAPVDINAAMRDLITARLGFGPPQQLTRKQKDLYAMVFRNVRIGVESAIREGATPSEALTEYVDIDGAIEVARDDPRMR